MRICKIGFVISGSDHLLFDPIVYQFINEESYLYNKYQEDSGFICSHCYRRILGKAHRIENDYLDTYCYSMRFILGYEEIKRAKSGTNLPDEI